MQFSGEKGFSISVFLKLTIRKCSALRRYSIPASRPSAQLKGETQKGWGLKWSHLFSREGKGHPNQTAHRLGSRHSCGTVLGWRLQMLAVEGRGLGSSLEGAASGRSRLTTAPSATWTAMSWAEGNLLTSGRSWEAAWPRCAPSSPGMRRGDGWKLVALNCRLTGSSVVRHRTWLSLQVPPTFQ